MTLVHRKIKSSSSLTVIYKGKGCSRVKRRNNYSRRTKMARLFIKCCSKQYFPKLTFRITMFNAKLGSLRTCHSVCTSRFFTSFVLSSSFFQFFFSTESVISLTNLINYQSRYAVRKPVKPLHLHLPVSWRAGVVHSRISWAPIRPVCAVHSKFDRHSRVQSRHSGCWAGCKWLARPALPSACCVPYLLYMDASYKYCVYATPPTGHVASNCLQCHKSCKQALSKNSCLTQDHINIGRASSKLSAASCWCARNRKLIGRFNANKQRVFVLCKERRVLEACRRFSGKYFEHTPMGPLGGSLTATPSFYFYNRVVEDTDLILRRSLF